MRVLIFLFAFGFSQDIPLKPKDEFEVKLDYQFKQRPMTEYNKVLLGGTSVKDYGHPAGSAILPYLVLNIKLLKLQEEKMRLLVSTNLDARARSKKVSVEDILALDLGFTDDMVDRVTAHEYIVTFLNSQKRPVCRIMINVEEDGSFFVNGEKRGRF